MKKKINSILEKTLTILSLAVIITGVFLLSGSMTGNVIGTFERSSTNLLGGLLFVMGLLGAFLTFK